MVVTHRTTFHVLIFLLAILAAGAGHLGRAQTKNPRPPFEMTSEDWEAFQKLGPGETEAFLRAKQQRYERELVEQWRQEQRQFGRRGLASAEKARRADENRLRLTLGVSDEQWQTLGPILRTIRTWKEQAALTASAPQFDANDLRVPFDEEICGYERSTVRVAGGGSYLRWGAPVAGGGTAAGVVGGAGALALGRVFITPFAWRQLEPENYEPSEGERLCEEFFVLLEDEDADPQQIARMSEALRHLRAKARRELTRAREELAPLLTTRQRARLILMGYLD